MDETLEIIEAFHFSATVVPAAFAGIAAACGFERVQNLILAVRIKIGDRRMLVFNADCNIARGIDVKKRPAGLAALYAAIVKRIEFFQVRRVGQKIPVAPPHIEQTRRNVAVSAFVIMRTRFEIAVRLNHEIRITLSRHLHDGFQLVDIVIQQYGHNVHPLKFLRPGLAEVLNRLPCALPCTLAISGVVVFFWVCVIDTDRDAPQAGSHEGGGIFLRNQ